MIIDLHQLRVHNYVNFPNLLKSMFMENKGLSNFIFIIIETEEWRKNMFIRFDHKELSCS